MTRDILQMALGALETEAAIYTDNDPEDGPPESMVVAITTLRAHLAKPEPTPVAWISAWDDVSTDRQAFGDTPVEPLYRRDDL